MQEDGVGQVYSYDRHFDAVEAGVERLEP